MTSNDGDGDDVRRTMVGPTNEAAPNLNRSRDSAEDSSGQGASTAAFLPDQDTNSKIAQSEGESLRVAVPGYEIVRTIGRGGMGVVYAARHLTLKRPVALKMILAGEHAGAAEIARFRIEAEAVARLQHPNIVQIHEVGESNG